MPLSPFTALPDHARLWLLALAAPAEPAALAPALEEVLGRWRHKGVAYRGAWALLEGRILAIAEPTLAAQPSGCAIDGMLRSLARALSSLGVALGDPEAVLVRRPQGLEVLAKADLGTCLAEGALAWDTPVLDLSLFELGDLRAGRLERPLARTWIGRKYKIQAPDEAGA